jgi:hypothetical protein
MNHFKPKSLAFYAIAIGSTVTLFQIVATYGERTLKAPSNVNGRYISTAAPPGCAEGDRLVLEIQQSGVYLNGSLRLQQETSPFPAAESSNETGLSLSGQWQQAQMALAGETDAFSSCGNSQSKLSTVTLQGQTQSEGLFVGQLNLENGTPLWQFQAEHQAPPKAQVAH